jgi:tetratricopeptide (TPR) repeat protein
MKRVSLLTMAAALAFGAAVPAAAYQPSDTVEEFNQRELGDELRGLIGAAQTALAAEEEGPVDTATVRGQLEQAEGMIQNQDERYIVGQMWIQLASKMQQQGDDAAEVQAMQARGIRLALDSNRVPIERRSLFWQVVANAASAAGDTAGAQTAFQNALHYDPNNPDALIQVALANFSAGNSAEGYQNARNAFAALRASGREIPTSWLSVPFRAAYEGNDLPRAIEFGREYLLEHPTATNWNEVLRVFQTVGRFDDAGNLDALRIMRAANAFDAPSINEYVQLAARRGLPNEAKTVYDAAVAGGAIPANPTIAGELDGDIPGDRSSLGESEVQARSAANGRIALNTADAYASYGQNDKALEMYALAEQKGSVDMDVVNLHRGALLFSMGRMDEARAAFEAVGGAREGHATFWQLLIDQRAGGSASASAEEPAE